MLKFFAVALFGLFLATPAHAQCAGSFLTDANSIRTDAAALSGGPAPIVLAGDSHFWRAKSAFPGGLSFAGRPVLFAGIQGATFATMRDCFPWEEVAATRPYAVVFMLGYNDAAAGVVPSAGTCCDAAGVIQTDYTHLMDLVVTKVKALSRNRVFASDPAQGTGASYNLALFNYSMAAKMKTYSTNFVDIYQLMPGTQCSSPYPYCSATVTTDGIHFPPAAYVTMVNYLLANVGYGD